MASIIKIKRSDATGGAPATLASGEFAYSSLVGTQGNGGDRLFIGVGTETSGNASGRHVVGGKYFTDMLDHVKGTLTADSAIVTDTNNLVDQLKAGTQAANLILSTNTISSESNSATDLAILFTPKNDGTLRIVQQGGATAYEDLILDPDDIPNKQYVDNQLAAVNSLEIVDEADSSQNVAFGVDDLKITGGEGIDTVVTKVGTRVTLTISGELATAATLAASANIGVSSYSLTGFDVASGFVTLKANVPQSVSTDGSAATPALNAFTIAGGVGLTTSGSGAIVTVDGNIAIAANSSNIANVGVASFDSANFEVDANGWVGIKDAGVSNAELVNSTITLGSSTLTLGATTTDIAGLTSLVVDDLTINGSSIEANGTADDIDIILNPKGTGVIDASSAQIVNVANPTQAQHAATKAYVDAVKTGLDIKDSVRVATTTTLSVSAAGSGVGKTLSNTGTLAAIEIDGITLALGDRVLVKDQGGVNPHEDNGIYTVTTLGDGSTPWVLTRAIDADQNPNTVGFSEVTAGLFTFVEEGTVNQDSGWVLTTDNPIVIDTTQLAFTQFSGAGSVDAGEGLSRIGTTLNVGEGDGILVTADHVSVNTSIAGDGLTATAGGTYGGAVTLQVVGTADRITVNPDSVDIAATYAGQNTITTLGTVTTGTWNATTLTVSYGGTGQTTFTSNGILFGNSSSPTGALGVTAAGTWDSVNDIGQILSVNASGVPTWTNTLDGGTY
jgi:hypothetical protein